MPVCEQKNGRIKESHPGKADRLHGKIRSVRREFPQEYDSDRENPQRQQQSGDMTPHVEERLIAAGQCAASIPTANASIRQITNVLTLELGVRSAHSIKRRTSGAQT